jgi:hypothetical protein
VTNALAYYEFITTVNKYKIERLARDERSSLFVLFVGDGENRFMTSHLVFGLAQTSLETFCDVVKLQFRQLVVQSPTLDVGKLVPESKLWVEKYFIYNNKM